MLVSVVWAVDTMRTVPQMKSVSTSNVLIHVNKREPVDLMLYAKFSTKMFNVPAQKDLQEFQLLNRVVSEFHPDVLIINVHLPIHAREDFAIFSVESMLIVPRENVALMVCVPRFATVTRTAFRGKSVLRLHVCQDVIRRRIVDQERFAKMATVFVVLVSSTLLQDVQTSMNVKSKDVILQPNVKTLQDPSSVHVPEDKLEIHFLKAVEIQMNAEPTEIVVPA